MKKIFLVVCFILGGITQTQATDCECGTHATSITTYHVGEGQGCCSGTPGGVGFFTRYELHEGVWQVVDRTELRGTVAQANCCPPV